MTKSAENKSKIEEEILRLEDIELKVSIYATIIQFKVFSSISCEFGGILMKFSEL